MLSPVATSRAVDSLATTKRRSPVGSGHGLHTLTNETGVDSSQLLVLAGAIFRSLSTPDTRLASK